MSPLASLRRALLKSAALSTRCKSDARTFDGHLQDAQQLQGKTQVDSSVVEVALHSMKMKMETEMEIMKMKMETKMEIMEMKMKWNFKQRESLRKQQLMYASQRLVVESFFSEVLAVLESADFKDKLSSLKVDEGAARQLQVILRKPHKATITSLNDVLKASPEIREVVWSELGLTCPFPRLGKHMTFDTVHGNIYTPFLEATFISKGSPDDLQEFFVQISKLADKNVEMVCPESAAAGREKWLKEIMEKESKN